MSRLVLVSLLLVPAVVSATINVSGPWSVGGSYIGGRWNFTQSGTALVVELPFHDPLYGSIDSVTGAFTLSGIGICPSTADTVTGNISADDTTLTAVEIVNIPHCAVTCSCDGMPENVVGTRLVGSCGNGQLDPGENCDDGNVTAGDGCEPDCRVEPCCGCSGVPSACVPAPRTPCKSSTAPEKSTLLIENVANDANDTLTWQWKKGAITALAELGNPPGGDDSTLCVYDESMATPALLFRALVPGGGTCDGNPCWKTKGKSGFGYKNNAATPQGVTVAKLEPGAAGHAKVLVKGKGRHLSDRPSALPVLPLPTSLRVQLQGAGGLCMETRHDAASVLKNDPVKGLFKARGAP